MRLLYDIRTQGGLSGLHSDQLDSALSALIDERVQCKNACATGQSAATTLIKEALMPLGYDEASAIRAAQFVDGIAMDMIENALSADVAR